VNEDDVFDELAIGHLTRRFAELERLSIDVPYLSTNTYRLSPVYTEMREINEQLQIFYNKKLLLLRKHE
jgi:hypothetical protein